MRVMLHFISSLLSHIHLGRFEFVSHRQILGILRSGLHHSTSVCRCVAPCSTGSTGHRAGLLWLGSKSLSYIPLAFVLFDKTVLGSWLTNHLFCQQPHVTQVANGFDPLTAVMSLDVWWDTCNTKELPDFSKSLRVHWVPFVEQEQWLYLAFFNKNIGVFPSSFLFSFW